MTSTLDHEQQPFPLHRSGDFEPLHGTPVVAIGQQCDALLMLGHPDQRTRTWTSPTGSGALAARGTVITPLVPLTVQVTAR